VVSEASLLEQATEDAADIVLVHERTVTSSRERIQFRSTTARSRHRSYGTA